MESEPAVLKDIPSPVEHATLIEHATVVEHATLKGQCRYFDQGVQR